MGKKKQYPKGIIALDPSWRGCGYIVYLPEEDFIKVGCVDLVEEFATRKAYDTPDSSRDLVCSFLYRLFSELGEEIRQKLDTLVIERQFKPKMQNLYKCFENQIKFALGPKSKVIGIAAWNTKEHFGTATATYRGNKQEAIAFLLRNPKLIGASLHDKNDNKADAIILLNHFLQKKYPEILMSRRNVSTVVRRPPPPSPISLDVSDIDCPECATPCAIKTCGPTSKNAGKEYNACINPDCPKSDKGGWIRLVGEQPKYPAKPKPRTVGSKRASTVVLSDSEESFEPVAKKRPAPDQFYEDCAKFHVDTLSILQTISNKLSMLNKSNQTYLDEMLSIMQNKGEPQSGDELCGTTDTKQ